MAVSPSQFPFWYTCEIQMPDAAGIYRGGIAIIEEVPGQGPDDIGEPIALLYGLDGTPLWQAERNALGIAAAPQLLGALMQMLQIFSGPSKIMGPEAALAVAEGIAAVRLVFSEEDQAEMDQATVDRVRARGGLQ